MAATSPSMSPMSTEDERMAKHDAGRTLLSGALAFDCPAPVQVKNTFIHVELPHTSSRSVIGSVTLPQKWVTAPAIVQERTFRTMQAALEQAHNEGRCKPCAYYYYKADGCRMGSQCQFCHLCTRGEIRRRKKERTRLLRQGLLPGTAAGAASSSGEAAAAGGGHLQIPAQAQVFSSSGSETRHRWEDMRERVVDGVNEVKEVVRRVTGDLARSVSGRSGRSAGAASPKKKQQQQQSASESHSSTEESSSQSD
mmetsp:Transcript_24930/g.54202  ORF Transcript_24930/g.54202 Transcript_24930/m.54202 type:complete len:253 (-) Transcript_24930:235-993(-)